MAYTPINWQTGDTITAEKLNRCDNGWSVETTSTTLCEETITTTSGNMGYNASLSYETPISADSLIVTFDGTEYTCTKSTAGNVVGYGGFTTSGTDFSTYPFAIVVRSGTNYVYTESAGTYTVKIAIPSATVEASDDFTSAVRSVTQTPLKITVGTTTFQEIYDAIYTSGRSAYVLTLSTTASQPHFIEPVIYVLKASSTFLVKTIGIDDNGSAPAIYTYTASSADGVITAS